MSETVTASGKVSVAETKATAFELVIETIGALMAALMLVAFLWSGEAATELATVLKSLKSAAIAAASFLPRLANLSLPEWYLGLVILSAATTAPQFRVAREMGYLTPARSGVARAGRFALAAVYILIASYSLLGLAIFAVLFLILRIGLRFFLSARADRHPEEMDGAVSTAMGAFYFIFMTLAFVAAFYATNALLLAGTR